MKTETQIAEENIEERKEKQGRTDWLGGQTLDLEIIGECNSHKATCQRFLEFLEGFMKNTTAKDSAWMSLIINPKITDLKQAIKLYEDAGI